MFSLVPPTHRPPAVSVLTLRLAGFASPPSTPSAQPIIQPTQQPAPPTAKPKSSLIPAPKPDSSRANIPQSKQKPTRQATATSTPKMTPPQQRLAQQYFRHMSVSTPPYTYPTTTAGVHPKKPRHTGASIPSHRPRSQLPQQKPSRIPTQCLTPRS